MPDEKQEILKQTIIEDDVPKKTLAEKLSVDRKKRKKKQLIRGVVFCFLALISYAIYWLFKPFKAPASYGICRSFIELNVPYPDTIEVNELKYLRDGSMRLWYTHTDAFGEFRMELFQCYFTYDQATGLVTGIDQIQMSKVNVPQEQVAALNYALPYFHENPVILNHPYVQNSLSSVVFDIEQFRRIKLDVEK